MSVLMMLNMLDGLAMPAVWADSARYIHLLAQVSQLAYAERDRWVCDPAFARTPLETLLSPAFADGLRQRLDPQAAIVAPPVVEPEHKDTVYLACVDRDGNAISFINSIFTDFGSAIYDAASGILLHNRGACFTPEAGHPNALAPGKRPMHTIIPGLAMRDGAPLMPFGVMGGHYQATGQVHLLSAMPCGGLIRGSRWNCRATSPSAERWNWNAACPPMSPPRWPPRDTRSPAPRGRSAAGRRCGSIAGTDIWSGDRTQEGWLCARLLGSHCWHR